jgi:hypothetical protein
MPLDLDALEENLFNAHYSATIMLLAICGQAKVAIDEENEQEAMVWLAYQTHGATKKCVDDWLCKDPTEPRQNVKCARRDR